MKRKHFATRRVIFVLLLCFISNTITAQKINLDTLTIDELNLYMNQAVRTRNIGMGMTLGGIGVAAGGIMGAYAYTLSTGGDEAGAIVFGGLSGVVGLVSIAVGVPLWAKGAKKKAESDLKLQTFNIVPENSMAVGLGIAIKF
jgi:hypothetical protein